MLPPPAHACACLHARQDVDEIVYAVAYNNKKDRHLDPLDLPAISTRPTLLITDAMNSLSVQQPRRVVDAQLCDTVMDVMRRGGNVLMPADTSCRLLELLAVLNDLWAERKLRNVYRLVLLTPYGSKVTSAAKGMLEWMSELMSKKFDDRGTSQMELDNVLRCSSLEEIAGMREPKVVLATQVSLECGFGRELLIAWAGNPLNMLLFTQRDGAAATLARKLACATLDRFFVRILRYRAVPLEGAELEEQLEKQRITREAAEASRLALLQVPTPTPPPFSL